MTDDIIEIQGGEVLASLEERTITGLLVPYGEVGRTNVGQFQVDAGVIRIPADPAVVGLNTDHDRFSPVGRATRVWEEPVGIMATFSIANTPEGDAALADARDPNGKRRRLSGEFLTGIKAGKATGGTLSGGALVEMGAFASAMVLAADTPETEPQPASGPSVTRCEDCGVELGVAGPSILTHHEDGSHTVASQTPEAAPAEATSAAPAAEQETVTVTEPTAPVQTPAPIVAPVLAAAAPTPEVNMTAVFAAMAELKANSKSEDALAVLAALADIKTTDVAAGVLQPAWVGKLWQGKKYIRKYLDLVTHTYGGISIAGRKGFKIDQGTALVAKRGGQKTELPTGSASFSTAGSTRESYGYAADIAREWFDLEGGAEVLEAFWQGVVESYAKVTDLDALATLFKVASRGSGAALSRRVAPAGLPAGTPANSAYYPGVAMLIQAIDIISDSDDPAWAVVNPVAWSQLLYTPKDLLPEYFNIAVNVAEGTASVDGKVTIRKAPNSTFVGLSNTAPQVMAGAKGAVEFREQGTTPIQIDAADVARYGLDRSIVGYLETFEVREESTVLIGTV